MPEQDPNQVLTNPHQLAAAEAARIEEFWTPDRMASAIPLPLPKVYLPRQLRQSRARLLDATAAGPIVSEPVPPDSPTVVPTASGFNTRIVGDLTVYPYAVTGKYFMTFGGANYVGSAWTIGERTVFTAGHCVHDKASGWATNVLFRAQFNNGTAINSWPLGILASLRGWIDDEDFEFDMAMGVSTTPIRPTTGKAGYIANVGPIQGKIKSIGYPAENIVPGYDFNGKRMWECDGDYINLEDNIHAMSNNMTGGCSGGPGFYQQSGNLYAMWVNSFRYTSEPNILRSPYFGRGFTNLIQWMKDYGGDI